MADTADLVTDADGWTLRSVTGCRTAHSEHTVAVTDDGIGIDEQVSAGVGMLSLRERDFVKLIDFAHPECNRFHAINQFRVDTPGGVKSCIIPDIVLFVNGIIPSDEPNNAVLYIGVLLIALAIGFAAVAVVTVIITLGAIMALFRWFQRRSQEAAA